MIILIMGFIFNKFAYVHITKTLYKYYFNVVFFSDNLYDC